VGLQPGEGTFQDAGVPHAYLEGATVELMACSDNVLRGGLTPKYVDVPELLRIIRFEEGASAVLRGEPRSEGEEAFATSAEEFELRRIRLQAGGRTRPVGAIGPECVLVMEGGVRLRFGARGLDLLRGGCVLIPHGLVYELEGVGAGGTVMRALVPPL
jgi:mannose-6-phosphate isomerase